MFVMKVNILLNFASGSLYLSVLCLRKVWHAAVVSWKAISLTQLREQVKIKNTLKWFVGCQGKL